MKLVGFLLLVSGWALVLSALILLGSSLPRTIFALAGVGVQTLGLVLVFRSHLVPRRERG